MWPLLWINDAKSIMVLLSYLSYSLSVVEICLLSILLQRHKKKGVMEIMLICQNKNYVDIHNLVFALFWQLLYPKYRCINEFDTESYKILMHHISTKCSSIFHLWLKTILYLWQTLNLRSSGPWQEVQTPKHNAFSANIILTA